MKKVVIGLIIVSIVGYIAIRFWVCTVYNYDRDIRNQEQIAKGYVSFYRDKNELPPSLPQATRRCGLSASEGPFLSRAAWVLEPNGRAERGQTVIIGI